MPTVHFFSAAISNLKGQFTQNENYVIIYTPLFHDKPFFLLWNAKGLRFDLFIVQSEEDLEYTSVVIWINFMSFLELESSGSYS